MKRTAVFMVMAALAALVVPAFAEEKGAGAKIAHVDLQRVLNESEAGKRARTELEEMVRVRQTQIDEKVKAKERMDAEFQRQGAMMSADARNKKQEDIARLERDVKRLIQDSNAEVQSIQRDKERKILTEIEAVIAKIGKAEGFTLIVPSDIVIYSSDPTDITEKVREAFDAQAPKGGEDRK